MRAGWRVTAMAANGSFPTHGVAFLFFRQLQKSRLDRGKQSGRNVSGGFDIDFNLERSHLPSRTRRRQISCRWIGCCSYLLSRRKLTALILAVIVNDSNVAIGLCFEAGACLQQFVERQCVTHHHFVLQHGCVVLCESDPGLSFRDDLQVSGGRCCVVDDLAADVLTRQRSKTCAERRPLPPCDRR